jgi:hypothetical protein
MHIAQLNIAKMLGPIDSPIMADFVNNLEGINALAEESDGFIWRLTGEEDNATAIQVFDDMSIIINMSVWRDVDALKNYVYKTAHAEIMKRKKEWFSKMDSMHMVLWNIPEGHIPSPAEAKERLAYLNENGESDYAFTFKFAIKG